MADDRMKNFFGAALDLQDRATDYLDHGEVAKKALIIALRNFGLAHQSLRQLASEKLRKAGIPEP